MTFETWMEMLGIAKGTVSYGMMKTAWHESRKATIEECATLVGGHWNGANDVTNQKEQAARSAAAIRGLK